MKLWSPDRISGQPDYVTLPVLTPNSGDVKHHPFPAEAAHFLDCIIHDKGTDCPMSDAVKTQAVVLADGLSAVTGEVIHLSLK